jgi:hypothetical protein
MKVLLLTNNVNHMSVTQSFQLINNGFRVQGRQRLPILPKYYCHKFVPSTIFM